jgi:hypothetical protein
MSKEAVVPSTKETEENLNKPHPRESVFFFEIRTAALRNAS